MPHGSASPEACPRAVARKASSARTAPLRKRLGRQAELIHCLLRNGDNGCWPNADGGPQRPHCLGGHCIRAGPPLATSGGDWAIGVRQKPVTRHPSPLPRGEKGL